MYLKDFKVVTFSSRVWIQQDGQFDTKDLNEVYKSVMEVLEFSMPAGSGFAVGFLFGFRSG